MTKLNVLYSFTAPVWPWVYGPVDVYLFVSGGQVIPTLKETSCTEVVSPRSNSLIFVNIYTRLYFHLPFLSLPGSLDVSIVQTPTHLSKGKDNSQTWAAVLQKKKNNNKLLFIVPTKEEQRVTFFDLLWKSTRFWAARLSQRKIFELNVP